MNADDGRVIIETFNQKFAQSLKPRVEFVVVPAMVYLESFNKAGAYLNEGTTLNETFVREIESRVSEVGINRFILVDTNPEDPMHFLKTSYIDQTDSKLKNGKTHIKDRKSVV